MMKEGTTLQPVVIKEITAKHIAQYADGSGDYSPIHLNHEAAQQAGFDQPIAHGMWTMGLGTKLISQIISSDVQVTHYDVSFIYPVMIGDSLTISGTVAEVSSEQATILLKGENQHEETIIKGKMIVKGWENEKAPG